MLGFTMLKFQRIILTKKDQGLSKEISIGLQGFLRKKFISNESSSVKLTLFSHILVMVRKTEVLYL